MTLTSKEYWDRGYTATSESKRAQINPARDYFADDFLSLVTPHLPISTDEGRVRLLEMGCGNSLWLPYFAQHWNYQPTGLDYSAEGCRQAENNLLRARCTGDIHCGDFTDLGDDLSDCFDLVVSFGVVEHFERTAEVLGYFAKCLKPGGLNITAIPNMAGTMGGLQRLLDKQIYDLHVPLDLDALVAAHEAAGLRIRFASYCGFLQLGMINTSRLALGSWIARVFYGLDRLHLVLRRLSGIRPQNPKWSSFVVVIAERAR